MKEFNANEVCMNGVMEMFCHVMILNDNYNRVLSIFQWSENMTETMSKERPKTNVTTVLMKIDRGNVSTQCISI